MHTVARISLRKTAAPKMATRKVISPAPIVKWAGGKTKLLDHLLSLRPQRYRRYFEPFMGGGALFFRLQPANAVLSDQNEDLINMYRCVAWNVEAVIRRLSSHRTQHSEEHYYEVRSLWNDRNKRQTDVRRAAAFIYLNKTCYNGLWRVNKKGLFNVPMGRYESPRIFDPKRLRAAARALQRAQLEPGSFAEIVDQARAGDFLYFDPPYDPLTESSNFTSYTAGSFDKEDQQALAAVVRRLSDLGCAIMVSNSDTRFIRRLYRGFDIHSAKMTRSINSNAASRGAVGELIVTNSR